jgi:hypothetical protein
LYVNEKRATKFGVNDVYYGLKKSILGMDNDLFVKEEANIQMQGPGTAHTYLIGRCRFLSRYFQVGKKPFYLCAFSAHLRSLGYRGGSRRFPEVYQIIFL